VEIYDMATGKCLAGTRLQGQMPQFTPGGSEVLLYYSEPNREGEWETIKDNEFNPPELMLLGRWQSIPKKSPWKSYHDYQVMDDGWLLSSSGKRLLWMPHNWRSSKMSRVWSEHFLALLHSGLPEVMILELLEE
jgi:hypothetical protein